MRKQSSTSASTPSTAMGCSAQQASSVGRRQLAARRTSAEIKPSSLSVRVRQVEVQRSRSFLTADSPPPTGFDASQHESAGMSRHRRNVPTSFFHRFSREICRFANEHSSGKVLAVLEGGYSDRALSSGALATMVGLTESPRLLEKTFLVEDGDEMGWWSEANLGKLERACKKPRRSKIPPPSTNPSNISTTGGEAWLSRAVEIFSLIEGPETTVRPPKEKQEPERWMQLRERRPRGAVASSEVTPQSSPPKSFQPARSGVEVPDAEARSSGMAQEEMEGETKSVGEGSSGEAHQAPPPKIRFTFRQGGI